jgi:hypothetical protein
MSIAEQIVSQSKNSFEAMNAADLLSEGDQNWEGETTAWTFDDDSKLIVSGPSFCAEN